MVWLNLATRLIITKVAKVMILTNNQQALENSCEIFFKHFYSELFVNFSMQIHLHFERKNIIFIIKTDLILLLILVRTIRWYNKHHSSSMQHISSLVCCIYRTWKLKSTAWQEDNPEILLGLSLQADKTACENNGELLVVNTELFYQKRKTNGILHG